MRLEPPSTLVSLLSALGLATADEVRSAAPLVKRLAADLGDFESVWLDALVEKRLLTPFQAGEISHGRGEKLRHGPYLVTTALGQTHAARIFAARHVETQAVARLYVIERPSSAVSAAALAQLVDKLRPLAALDSAVALDAGRGGDVAWAACCGIEGTNAARWMVEHGRFPAEATPHVARAMLERLAEYDALGVVHGNLCPQELYLDRSGAAILPMPGLRGVVRPAEGYGFADLPPEAYDYLAPERVVHGGPPSVASDIYACGALWWHLVTGRPPHSGGNGLAKLKAAQAGRIADVRHLAPDVPASLARAVDACLARDPASRPQSFAELARIVGPAARGSGTALVALHSERPSAWSGSLGARRKARARTSRLPVGALAATAAILLLVALWPVWRRGSTASPPQPSIELVDARSSSAARVLEQPTSEASPAGGESVELASAAASPEAKPLDDLVLESDAVLRLVALDLHPRQRVRARAGQRATVIAPEHGLLVDQDEVTFEGVDFVDDRRGKERARSIVVLQGRGVTFRGCSFSSREERPAAAIEWRGAAGGEEGGEVTFVDCVFQGLDGVVVDRAPRGLSVEVSNSLLLTAGPLVRLERAPRFDESIGIALEHVTTRGDSPILECAYGRAVEACGPLAITANNSVLDGHPRGGLLVYDGVERPAKLLEATSWNGSGSLVSETTALAVWRQGKRRQALAEDELEVGGLVRSGVEFAGNAAAGPQASRVVRWHVPLRSSDPPGADTNSLFVPRL